MGNSSKIWSIVHFRKFYAKIRSRSKVLVFCLFKRKFGIVVKVVKVKDCDAQGLGFESHLRLNFSSSRLNTSQKGLIFSKADKIAYQSPAPGHIPMRQKRYRKIQSILNSKLNQPISMNF